MGTQAQIDATNELFDFQQKNAQAQKQIDRDILEAKLSTVSTSLGQIANLLGENSKFGKGLAVTQAIIDTYVGANKAISQGGIFGAVAAAGVIATGIANVKKNRRYKRAYCSFIRFGVYWRFNSCTYYIYTPCV
jgi:hypothetical protein